LNGQIQLSETLKDLLEQPLSLITFVIFIFIFGPLPEELGWRGYVLDELQEQMNAVVASIVLGVIWAIWHMPLFFMNGTYQNELGIGTLSFWQFCIFAVVFSVLITWVYNNNRSSTLSAALFHFIVNLTGNLIEISPTEELVRNILLVIITIIIVQIFGVSTLQRNQKQKKIVAT
jgi:membrane protease YdiL (CAAX protease family)